MKRFLLFIFLLNSVLALSQSEYIKSMDVILTVDTLADLTVEENIEVYANQQQIKRGIYRALPLTRESIEGRRVPIAYTILDVKLNGSTTPYHTEERSGFFNIYIGDENKILSPGLYKYSITYKTYGQIGFHEEFNELYWNVNGTAWTIPSRSVTAKIRLPGETGILEMNCYTGSQGSTAKNCESFGQPEVMFLAKDLGVKENLTISVAFEKGTIKQPPPPTLFERFRLLFLGIFTVLGLLFYYGYSWMKHGVDPPKPAVYPIYEPPNEISPAGLGSIYKDTIRKDLISASLINLAVKGYLTINEESSNGLTKLFKSSTYTITQIKKPDPSLPSEEKALLESLFTSNKSVVFDDKYNDKVRTAAIRYDHELKTNYNHIINNGRNTKFLVVPILAVILFFVVSIMLGDLVIPSSVTNFFVGGFSFIIFSSFFIFPLLMHLFKKSNRNVLMFLPILIIGGIIFMMYQMPSVSLNAYIIIGFLAFAAVSIVLYKYLIERPSEEKLSLQSQVEGFKMYMEAAEDNQIKSFNPPDMTPEIFEKYLPYAIALGVDKIWGEKFQDYLTKAALNNEYRSSWYIGNRPFSPNLYHVMNTSVNKGINTTSTPPSQSGGGNWSSGTGGGGFSGGGGGGGGGGGW